MTTVEQAALFDANRLSERIAEAERLRRDGASEDEIASVEPSKEEIKQALMALRSRRAAQPPAQPRAKAQSKMSMDELLGGL